MILKMNNDMRWQEWTKEDWNKTTGPEINFKLRWEENVRTKNRGAVRKMDEEAADWAKNNATQEGSE